MDKSVADIAHQNAQNRNAAVSDPHNIKQNPADSKDAAASNVEENAKSLKENEIIDNLLANYTSIWAKQERNIKAFRSFLNYKCNAISNATVIQANSLAGTMFIYDGETKRKMEVKPDLFNLFPKLVVNKVDVTLRRLALIFRHGKVDDRMYHALNERRRSFVEDMQLYGDALLFLPAFSFRRNTAMSLRALYSLEDFNHDPRPVFFYPIYLASLAEFCHERGITSLRLSTGIMMASLVLELCDNVYLYGFWPFGTHPYTGQKLNNHYYDNRPVNKRMHAMPAEFKALLDLHNNGVIHLHLQEYTN